MPRLTRLAVLGMVDGNGPPYSWSAIINGYNPEEMAVCPYPVIAQYLASAPRDQVGMEGVRVTHIWTDDPADARRVARASFVPNVVERGEDVIGQVDAVLIATDIGAEHVERSRRFVESGLPVFVDKPLADNEADLATFCTWVQGGASVLSSSCLRYCKEFQPYRESTRELGAMRLAISTTPKSWERYGIHALEAAYCILGPGFLSAKHVGIMGQDIVHYHHRSGAHLVVAAIADLKGAFTVSLYGTLGRATAGLSDMFFAFRSQLAEFIRFAQTGIRPFPFAETVELMRMLIAGIRSRNEGGREILLTDIAAGGRFGWQFTVE